MSCELVDLRKAEPRIVLDIRYATENNFIGRVVYPAPHAFVHKDLVAPMQQVQTRLEALGLGLKLYDGFRPLSVQQLFWDFLPDGRYVANPSKNPRHARGTAVDVTIVDQEGLELAMPTEFDHFSERAHRDCEDVPEQALQNRMLLEGLMAEAGFVPFQFEWWHFDLIGWESYPIFDLSFSDLLS